MTDKTRDQLWADTYTAEKAAGRFASNPAHEADMAVKAYDARLHAQVAALTAAPADTATASGAATIAATICKSVAELPDRNSPADWPDAMLVTHDELSQIVTAALASAPAQPSEDEDGKAFRTATRHGLTLRFYGNCAQSGMPGSPSAYEVVSGVDRAAAMREAIARAEVVIAGGGEPQRTQPTASAPAQPVQPASQAGEKTGHCHKRANDFCRCSRKAMLCDGVGPPPQPAAQGAERLIAAARHIADTATDLGEDFEVGSNAMASLSLALDEYDAAIAAQQGEKT